MLDGVGPAEINRVLAVTDALGIHREAVRIPLDTSAEGEVRISAGRIEIIAPAAADFEEWLRRLPEVIRSLDLSSVRRSGS